MPGQLPVNYATVGEAARGLLLCQKLNDRQLKHVGLHLYCAFCAMLEL